MKLVNEIARLHNLDVKHLIEFAGFEMSRKVFHVLESNGRLAIPHIYIDPFLKSYKETNYHLFIAYVKGLGYHPLSGSMSKIGFELILDYSDTASIDHFTSVNEQTVRLSFKDMFNNNIVVPGAFSLKKIQMPSGYAI